MLLETLGQGLTVPGRGHRRGGYLQHLVAGLLQLLPEAALGQIVAPLNDGKQLTQCFPQAFAIGPVLPARQCRQELDVADQVRQAELDGDPALAHVPPIRRKVVAAQHPRELTAHYLHQHIGTPRGIDLEQRVQVGTEAPGPPRLTVVLVTRLIHIEVALAGQVLIQLGIGPLQGLADLANDLGQLPPRDGHLDDIAQELADRRERRMTHPLQVGDQGRQLGADQAALDDGQRQRHVEGFLTTPTPILVTGMLRDDQRRPGDVDLLDNVRHVTIASQIPAATRTGLENVRLEVRDLFRRERRTFVFEMSGLAADSPPAAARTFRLDEIRGRRLGGGR